MRKLVFSAFALALFASFAPAQNNVNSNSTTRQANANTRAARPRAPVFRANQDQIKQAQSVLNGGTSTRATAAASSISRRATA